MVSCHLLLVFSVNNLSVSEDDCYLFVREADLVFLCCNVDAEITVDFDDSIIEDTAEIKRQAMLELNVGLISMTEYYRQVYKLSSEQAEEYAKKMLAERVAEMQAIPVQEEPEPEV